MSTVQIILAIWLGGWAISAAAYVHSSIKRARMAGMSWSPMQHLAPISAILLTWLPSLIIYLIAWVKHWSRNA